jgi:hypothetical protein
LRGVLKKGGGGGGFDGSSFGFDVREWWRSWQQWQHYLAHKFQVVFFARC